MATSHLGRKKKKSAFTSISQFAEAQMNRDLVKAKNYKTGLTNIKKFTRQKLMG